MPIQFSWDRRKAESNFRKHGVSFVEAATVFGDPLSVTIADPDHSSEECRYLILGHSSAARVLVVAHAEIRGTIRLISARRATRREKKFHAEEQR